jgi:hypothetical protein
MNAADTRASSAIALCTPLTVVSRSSTTFAIDTFINDVSTTSTNIAIASSTARRRLPGGHPCSPLAPDAASSGTSSVEDSTRPSVSFGDRTGKGADMRLGPAPGWRRAGWGQPHQRLARWRAGACTAARLP